MEMLDHEADAIRQENATVTTSTANELTTEPAADENPATDRTPLTVESLIERLKQMAGDDDAEISTDEVGRIKQHFYHLRSQAARAAKAEASEEEAEAAATPEETADPVEEEFKALLAQVTEKKAAQRARIEAEQLANLERKKAIIAQINEMAADTDNVNRHYPAVKELQTQFKEIGEVPQTDFTETWKNYQDAIEHFYDQWKVNKELRDYDFKKNLAEKQLLIEEAVKLNEEPDVVTGFRRLQELHDKWREIGPVAKEFREEIWNKFKDASAEVNKRYQAFFEERKKRETENENAKTALCEAIEAIDLTSLTSQAAWNKATKTIIDAQQQWKQLGFASRKTNAALFARFRRRCDEFFAAKAEFFQSLKNDQQANLEAKTALCEQAEALKDSTDWKRATDKIVELQTKWKTIGPAPKKHSDQIWQRFLAACDHFFKQKKAATSETRKTEATNLATKREILARLTELNSPQATAERKAAIEEIHTLRKKWQDTGHVPYREKEKLGEEYRETVRQLFDKYDIHETKARKASFEASIEEIAADKTRLSRERERLMRAYEARKADLATYENNLGFFNSKSKSGESMLRDIQRNITRLKADLADLENKIGLIDSKL